MTKVFQNLLMLITCLLMLAGAAVARYGTVAGYPKALTVAVADAEKSVGDTMSINTTTLCGSVSGYAGPTPLMVYVTDGRVDSVVALPNVETPRFFSRVKSGLLHRWDGLTPEEALALDVDGVTGATYSSQSVIANVRAAMEYAASKTVSTDAAPRFEPSAGFFVSLAVVLAGCVMPLFVHSRRYRLVQLAMNVIVLGFWTGSFIDYIAMIGLVGRGIAGWSSLVLLIMLVAAFVYPMFGRINHYCLWICPLGSLQELLGMTGLPKIRLSKNAVSAFEWFRMALWTALMLAMWIGGWFVWTDYELFAAFMVDSAVVGLIIAGIAVCVLSLFISRPYCRFICPTGTLFRIAEYNRPKNK